MLPEIISEDSEGTKSLDYSKLTALLIEAVKEQQATILEMSERIRGLEMVLELTNNIAYADIEDMQN